MVAINYSGLKRDFCVRHDSDSGSICLLRSSRALVGRKKKKVTGGDEQLEPAILEKIIPETLRLLCSSRQVIFIREAAWPQGSPWSLFLTFWINTALPTEAATKLQSNNDKHFPKRAFWSWRCLERVAPSPNLSSWGSTWHDLFGKISGLAPEHVAIFPLKMSLYFYLIPANQFIRRKSPLIRYIYS